MLRKPDQRRRPPGRRANSRREANEAAHEGEGHHIPAAAGLARKDKKLLWPTGRQLMILRMSAAFAPLSDVQSHPWLWGAPWPWLCLVAVVAGASKAARSWRW